MKNTIIITILAVSLIVCALALVAAKRNEREMAEQNAELQAQLEAEQKYSGIGKIVTGIGAAIAAIF